MSRALATVLSLLTLLATALPVAGSDPEPPRPSKVPAGDVTGAADGAVAIDEQVGEVVPGEVIVKWRNAGRGPEVARSRGLAVVAELGAPGNGLSSLLSTGGRSVDAVVAELQRDPAVEYAEPNYVVSLVGTVSVNDPKTAGQYSLDRMMVRHAWGRSKGASNLIAVLDTGVQSGHPDLKGRVVRGYDFVNNDTGASDDNGHGTWVAGIIAANANDGYGIAGISWTDKILPVKIMNANGTGSTADLASGIYWSAGKGAAVINMSVGGFPYSQAVLDAVNYAWNQGAVLVGAAGNNNRRENYYPASYDRVISVSATQVNDEFSHWSSYGPKVNVSAPGSSVLTTNCTVSACPKRGWGSHTYISGTSFATPNVAGVVALIKARHPSYTPSQIVSRLYNTVDDRGYAGRDERYGLGRVNAYRALGGSVAQPGLLAGDGMEPNNSLSSARRISNGATIAPTIYPAGDEDWFRVRIPRAGRLDVRVTGVADSRDYPWNRSSLPVDPIVELYNRYGALIKRVDNEWETGTEVARHSVGKGTVMYVRVLNYFANGSRRSYSVTPVFTDDVAPVATIRSPLPGSTEVSPWVVARATFNEAVRNVSSTTVRLRDMETRKLVPASVAYDSSSREVRLTPSTRLAGNRVYRVELTSGITDVAGNPLSPTRGRFTTSNLVFRDIDGNPHAAEIQWLGIRRMVAGCGAGRFCPYADLNRMSTAVWLVRALKLPATTTDFFRDDDGRRQEDAINRVAAAGLMSGCETGRFCPGRDVRRGEMAAIVAAAFDLPPVHRDYFYDDDGLWFEDAVNRMAAAGLVEGCRATKFCYKRVVERHEMAGVLYRAMQR